MDNFKKRHQDREREIQKAKDDFKKKLLENDLSKRTSHLAQMLISNDEVEFQKTFRQLSDQMVKYIEN